MSRNSFLLSFSLFLSLGEVTAVPHRRIAASPSASVVFAQSFTFPRVCANRMYTCIHGGMYAVARQIRIYVQLGVVYPRGEAYVSRITTMHILQRPSIPVHIISFKRTTCRTPRCVNHHKKNKYNFFIARIFFCLNKKLNVFYFSFTTSHWED